MSEKTFDTRVLAEVSITVALSIVLNYIKIFQMPYGGSITLGSMVPVVLLALRRGWKIGIFSGVVFGLVQLVLDGYIGMYHPISLLLDYPLAFGCLGLAGFFKKNPIIGVFVALTGRLISHFVSGVVFFGMYAPEGMSPVVYSAIYNASYMVPEMIITGIIIYFVWKRMPSTLNV